MRVHSLELEAFGPFAKRAVIDFDALSEAGIFLLNGETGAGKTSVLDGICYALYGSLPGVRTGNKSLRSDHAPEHVAPEVICEFSTSGRRFEVTRSPAWERPSKRAKSGFTTEKAQSRLRERVDGAWVEKSTRNDEVGHTLLGILGLTMEQFTKVAMLPQGAFAAFLRASDKDREGLLRSLFDTSEYAMAERVLADRLTAARAEAEDAARARATTVQALVDDAQTTLFAEVDTAAAESAEAGMVEGGSEAPAGLPAAARELLEAGADKELGEMLRGEVVTSRDAVAKQRVEAEAALEAAREIRTALDQRATRHRQLAELVALGVAHDARAEAIAELGALLEADARAVGLRPYHQQLTDAKAQADHAQHLLGAAILAIERGEPHDALLIQDTSVDDLLDAARAEDPAPRILTELATHGTEAAKSSRAAAALIQAALPEESELTQIRGGILTLGEQLKTCTVEQGERGDRIAELGEQLPALRIKHQELSALAESATVLEAAVQSATERVNAVKARTMAHGAQVTAHALWNTARTSALQAREELSELLSLRLEQAAAALAQELEAGEPCLVCGSTIHPAPATVQEGQLVGPDDVEAAQLVLGQREKAEEKQRAALKTADTALDVARGKIGELSPEDSNAELVQATATHTRAVESGRQATAARQALETAESELERVKVDEAKNATELEVTATKLAAEQARATKLADRLNTLGREGQSLAELHAILDDAASALDALVAAVQARAGAISTHTAAASLWASKLGEIGVVDTDAWQELLLDDERRTADQQRVRTHNDQAVRIKTLAEAPGIDAARQENAAGIGAPEEDEITEANSGLELSTGSRDGLLTRDAVLSGYAARLEAALDRLTVLAREAGPVVERFETLKGIAELARGAGENRLKMTLSTYVLAARLESVALAATERLLAMTGGRYALLHDDAPRGNNKSGLGLQILDYWTGAKRDTQTLSGGESFMASLALALGLADVISHASGGIDIETLFVDEGFGSLDGETLEVVMDALENLRSGGRVIGVVSHVADMKQRITTQLNVHKSRTGSTVSMRAGM